MTSSHQLSKTARAALDRGPRIAGRAAMSVLAAAAICALGAGDSPAGGETCTFKASAGGRRGAVPGELTFETPRGYQVTLTQAHLYVGAVYLNEGVPTSVSSDTSCFLSGVYVAEVTEGALVDLLSSKPTAFPGLGLATDTRARTAEVWLSSGEVDAPNDGAVVAQVAGIARRKQLS